MKIEDVKAVVYKHIDKLITEWFGDKPLFKGLAKTVLQANINKYDYLLDMLTDKDGNLLFDELVSNLGDAIEKGYEIDLTSISPLLPNRILLISKEDIQALINEIKGSN